MDRVLGGVCGGFAAAIGVGAWWVRAALLAFILARPLVGGLLYALFWVGLPAQSLTDLPIIGVPKYPRPEAILIIGALSVLIGVLALSANLNILSAPQGDLVPPILLLLIGLTLLIRQFRRG